MSSPGNTPLAAVLPTASATLVVFDLDGTLVDSIGDINAALRVALRAVDDGRMSHDADEEALRRGAHGQPLEGFFRSARPSSGHEAVKAFIAAYRQHYHAHLLDTTQPFPGVREGLGRLAALREKSRRADGTPQLHLAVATTKLTATARRVVMELGLGEFFDWVQGSDGLKVKPDPQVLHVTMQALGHAPTARGPAQAADGVTGVPPRPWGLMVGDTEFDILAGRAAGLATCAVAWSEIPRDRLMQAEPDHLAAEFAHIVDLVADQLRQRR